MMHEQRLSREDLQNVMKTALVLYDGTMEFFCAVCGKRVDGTTHPRMQEALIKLFNEEVGRSIENKITRLIVEDVGSNQDGPS